MIEVTHAMYRYPSGERVGPFDLTVAAGELVVLAGPTGSGKSTLLRMIVGIAQRHAHGTVSGEVRVDGRDPAAVQASERVRLIGFVGQDPDDTVVCASVWAEAAFAMQNVGEAPDVVTRRVGESLAAVGLTGRDWRDPRDLSGGQRQRLAIAAALAAGARSLVLDEPLAHLDPDGAAEVVALLRRLADGGTAVLVVEHRLAALDAVADRVIRWGTSDRVSAPRPVEPRIGEVLTRFQDVRYVFGVSDVSLVVHRGERLAVVGANGSGKSTLLRLMAGELRASAGRVEGARGLLVPQNPDLGLFCETVADELAYAPRERRGSLDVVGRTAAAMQVDMLLSRPPQALSRGQRLRVAVAAAMTAEPALLLLDEPTSGQDAAAVDAMFGALAEAGGTVVFASHDLALVRRFATRAIVLREGRVAGEGLPEEVVAAPSPPVTPPAPGTPPGPADVPARILALAAVGVAALVLDRPVSLGLLAAACLAAALIPRRMAGWRLRLVGTLLLLAWSTALSQGLFYAGQPRTPFAVGPVTLWREGFAHGLVQSLRFGAVACAGLALAVSTPTERLTEALVRLRVPWGLALMATTALRFVPIVGSEVLATRRARSRRGRPLWRRWPWHWAREEAALLRPVAARALRRARSLAETLDARGFHPTAPRRLAGVGRVMRERLPAIVFASLTTLAVGARAAFILYGAEIVYLPALRPLYAWVRAWL